MEEKYNIKYNLKDNNIGVVGDHTTVNGSFLQNLNSKQKLDYDKLYNELKQLKETLKNNTKLPETNKEKIENAIEKIENAKSGAKEKNGDKILKNLKSAGQWVSNVATSIGVEIVAEIIKKQTEI